MCYTYKDMHFLVAAARCLRRIFPAPYFSRDTASAHAPNASNSRLGFMGTDEIKGFEVAGGGNGLPVIPFRAKVEAARQE